MATTSEPQFLIDTVAINRKYAAMKHDPRRWWTGVFQAPVGCSDGQRRRLAYDACGRWIEAMKKRRWDLVGRVSMYGPRRAHDINTNITLLDREEYILRAVFKLADTPVTELIEIPTGLIKRDPEHTITLHEAIAAR